MLLSDQKKIFFGCANGLSGYPYNNTIVEPKDAIKKTPNSVLYVSMLSIPIVIVENNPAKKDFLISNFLILIIILKPC